MRLRLTREWLEEQAKHERLILGGDVSPDTYDAAVAHALVQAINEIGVTKDGMYAECCVTRDTRSFLWDRAQELLTEWGYGDGCG